MFGKMTQSATATRTAAQEAETSQQNNTAASSPGESSRTLQGEEGTATTERKTSDHDAPPVASGGGVPPNADETKDFERQSVGKRAIVMLALCLAVFLAALDVTIITTALPTIVEQFHSPSGYTWIGAAFLLGNAASVTIWGKVSDIFGRKPVLLIANVVFLVGSLVCALAHSIGMLLAGRAVQGIGAGGLVILVNISIADLFSMRNRGQYYGMVGGVWALASAIGPIIGGAFTQKVSWRWCFYINLPLDGIAFFIIFFFLDIKHPRTPIIQGLKAIDWLGAVTVIGATLMFLFGLEFGGTQHPWDSAIVLCLIIFGVVAFGLFIVIQWKVAKYPIAPVALFSTVSLGANYFIVFIHGMVFIASSYYLPLYFQACRGASPLISGVYLLPNCISLSIGSLGVGIWIKKTGRYMEVIYLGFFLMTLGYGLLIDLQADSSLAKVIIYQLIAGLGIGPLFQAPLISMQSQVKGRDMATATAAFGFVRQLSTSISVVVGGAIYQNQLANKWSGRLIAALGPQTGAALSGAGAGANVMLVDTLPQPGKDVARDAYADSLSKIWILYTVLSFVGLCVVPLIRRNTLSKRHEEAKTGLAAEKEKAEERKAEKEATRTARKSTDVEKSTAAEES